MALTHGMISPTCRPCGIMPVQFFMHSACGSVWQIAQTIAVNLAKSLAIFQREAQGGANIPVCAFWTFWKQCPRSSRAWHPGQTGMSVLHSCRLCRGTVATLPRGAGKLLIIMGTHLAAKPQFIGDAQYNALLLHQPQTPPGVAGGGVLTGAVPHVLAVAAARSFAVVYA
jgi:hypothetical protein